MTATNIILDDFIRVLMKIRESNIEMVDMDMIPDPDVPGMNKLILHPVTSHPKKQSDVVIRNPHISTDNNDIYDLFEGLI